MKPLKPLILTIFALGMSACNLMQPIKHSYEPIAQKEADEEVNQDYKIETIPIDEHVVKEVLLSSEFQDLSEHQVQKLLDQDTYQFNFDSSKLNSHDYQSLDVKAVYLKSKLGDNKNIIIQGHTDEKGTRTYNLSLGERRANAVKQYLVAKGIPSNRIEVISYGFERPLDDSNTEEAWAKNRRAEILVE